MVPFRLIGLVICTGLFLALFGAAAQASLSGSTTEAVYQPVYRAVSQPGPFSDVPADHWAAPEITRLAGAKILTGDGNGRFRPDAPVTRAQLAKILVTSRGFEVDPPPAAPSFTDVPKTYWAYPYIEMAYRLAYIQGRGNRFQPDDPVTREDLAIIMTRVLAWEGEAQQLGYRTTVKSLPFSDIWSIDDSFRQYVAQAVRKGVMKGYSDGSFRPAEPATRAQAGLVVGRWLLGWSQGGQKRIVEGRNLKVLAEYDMIATAYGAGEYWLSDRTALGLLVRDGIVAVDPTVIPLGSHLYVENYGYALAGDTGGAIRGHRIDLYYGASAAFVADFGLQKRKVYLLDKP